MYFITNASNQFKQVQEIKENALYAEHRQFKFKIHQFCNDI
jgi:hypothetical protein